MRLAARGGRPQCEAFCVDLCAAYLAMTVGSLTEGLDGPVDEREFTLGLSDELPSDDSPSLFPSVLAGLGGTPLGLHPSDCRSS